MTLYIERYIKYTYFYLFVYTKYNTININRQLRIRLCTITACRAQTHAYRKGICLQSEQPGLINSFTIEGLARVAVGLRTDENTA